MIDGILILRSLSQSEYGIVTTTLNTVTNCNSQNVTKHYTKVKNLRVTIYPTHLVISGSLPRFYTGSDLSCITRQGIENAIKELEHYVGISLDDGLVYKLELSQLVYLSKPLQSYFSVFDKASYCKKREYPTSLLFYNKSRSIIMYDKKAIISKSTKCKGIKDVTFDFLGVPVKVEIRLKKRIKRQLASFYKKQANNGIDYQFRSYSIGDTLKVIDLYQEDTYNFLYSYWLDTISSIKINKKSLHTPNHLDIISKVKDTFNYYR